MSAPAITLAQWDGRMLRPAAPDESTPHTLTVADSWLVVDGRALAIGLHRERFLETATDPDAVGDRLAAQAEAFWHALIETIPRHGSWFPRAEARSSNGHTSFWAQLRPSPVLTRSVVVRSLDSDPRTVPTVKGPDLDALVRLRTVAQADGVDEPVVLSPDGHIVEGITSAFMWWRGDAIAMPDAELGRVNSVTARIVHTLAAARGIPVVHERATPAELEGHEVWVLNALHGARIVRRWVDGPALAEEPGRLAQWHQLLTGLRRPLDA